MCPSAFADGSGVPISQQIRGLPSARKVLIIALCEQRAAGTRRRRNAPDTPPGPEVRQAKQSRMDNSSAYGVKGQFIFQPPGGTRAQTVQAAVGIAANATRTV
ncbi:hypothetical protein TcG_01805 [Trypanosoma cruzi]|nr:hypothetical protein TcG_01805 [Trypanosoma cruzi]